MLNIILHLKENVQRSCVFFFHHIFRKYLFKLNIHNTQHYVNYYLFFFIFRQNINCP